MSEAHAPVVTVTGRDYLFITRDEYARPGARRGCAPALPAGARGPQHRARRRARGAARARETVGPDAVLLVLPADHLIANVDGVRRRRREGARARRTGYLVTFGVVPTRPETGYGYIQSAAPIGTDGHEIARFVEKPDLETARAYVASGEYLWNSGMFCFGAGTLLAAAARTCPDVLAAARAVLRGDARAAATRSTTRRTRSSRCPTSRSTTR